MIIWPTAYFEAGKPGEKGIRITTRISFSVKKTDTGFSNKATIKAWNLSEESITGIQKNGTVIRLSVKEGSLNQILFTGDIDETRIISQGPDDILEIQTGDGEKKLMSFMEFSLDRGQTWKSVLNLAAQALGVPLGTVKGLPEQTLKRAYSFSGPAKNMLDSLAKKYDLNWSVQNGILQILPASEALKTSAVVLNKKTGLTDGLTRDSNKKLIKGKSQLNPGITPGRILQITSEKYGGVIDDLTGLTTGSGLFKTTEVSHRGDSGGSPWESSFTAIMTGGS